MVEFDIVLDISSLRQKQPMLSLIWVAEEVSSINLFYIITDIIVME